MRLKKNFFKLWFDITPQRNIMILNAVEASNAVEHRMLCNIGGVETKGPVSPSGASNAVIECCGASMLWNIRGKKRDKKRDNFFTRPGTENSCMY